MLFAHGSGSSRFSPRNRLVAHALEGWEAAGLKAVAAANNGDVLVNTQIKNSNINNGNSGGSLNLYASNDIKVNRVAGTNDVTIGDVVVSHKNVVIEAGQPPAFEAIDTDLSDSAKLDALVNALNSIKVPNEDRIAIIQGGKIRAAGTMDDLRKHAQDGTEGLESIFLRLTGENAARELVDVLDA